MMLRHTWLMLVVTIAATSLPGGPATAWGHSGHQQVSTLAMQALPEEVPALLRDEAAVALVGALGAELDLSKGGGNPHDAELDPGHYVDLDDKGLVFGVLALDELPASREAYDTRLRAGGFTQYSAGYLPYSLLGGWQQLRKDFAWLRVALAGQARAETAEERDWFIAFVAHRRQLALHNLGIWSHYVADASQPLHVSVHFNGWGDYPNPRGFSQDRSLHARFEGEFVRSAVDWAMVAAAMPAYRDCACPPPQRLAQYLRATQAQVVPLYELEQAGAFTGSGTAAGRGFTVARLAAGAAELRDLVVDAWRASASAQIGWPALSVADIEAGQVAVTRRSFWRD
jgi:hypothetical protein